MGVALEVGFRQLIRMLHAEDISVESMEIEQLTLDSLFQVYRQLVNVRPAKPIANEWLVLQNKVLSQYNLRNSVSLSQLTPVWQKGKASIYLWQGDITTLSIESIVNAANSDLEGCFIPGHACIDNIIHTKSGIQLRQACHDKRIERGRKIAVGQVVLTSAYNLPSRYVLHTVGPNVTGKTPKPFHCEQLAECYGRCLNTAIEHGIEEMAFCGISTGVFGFPRQEAAEIAIKVVKNHLSAQCDQAMSVVFNVFETADWEIYDRLLREYSQGKKKEETDE